MIGGSPWLRVGFAAGVRVLLVVVVAVALVGAVRSAGVDGVRSCESGVALSGGA